MKKELFSSNLWIKTDRYYPANELFVLANEKIGGKFVPINTKKELGVEKIYFQGVDKYTLYIFSCKKGKEGRVIVCQYKPIKQALKDSVVLTIICVITLGIGFFVWRVVDKIKTIFGIEGTKNSRALMRELGTEIEKLIGK
ncbi:MAG: hypothetical protein FWG98_08755 [Candidatus Cloacimonetes bacterium]|nr:hypothetical protein [Candidatus Cloacimonadota bacterium]